MKSAVIVLALTPAFLFAGARSEAANRITSAAMVFQEIMNNPDQAIPQSVLRRARCVVIIPHEVQGGFIVGARYGVGVATCRTASGRWSAPSQEVVEGGSIGFQAGGQEKDVVLIIQSKRGEEGLLSNHFTLNAGAGAVAGPVGYTAGRQTDAQFNADILTYTRSKGLFAGADLGGATLRPDNNANRDLYGRPVTESEILSGQVPPPPAAQRLYQELDRYSRA